MDEPHQDGVTQGKVLTAALLVMGLDTMQGTVRIKEGVRQQSHKEDPHVRGEEMTTVGKTLPLLQAKDRVTKLQEKLRAAELEVSLAEHIVTANVLHGSQGTSNSTTEDQDTEALSLGPIVEAEIRISGGIQLLL